MKHMFYKLKKVVKTANQREQRYNDRAESFMKEIMKCFIYKAGIGPFQRHDDAEVA